MQNSSKNVPTRIYEGYKDSNINIQELLKQEIYDEKITPLSNNPANRNNSNASQRSQPNKPYSEQTVGVSDQYLILDTFLKSVDSAPTRGELKWNIYAQGSTSNNPPVVGVLNNLSTVVDIQTGSFSMPIPSEHLYPLSDLSLIKNLLSIGISLIQNNATNFNPAPAKISANLAPILDVSQLPQGVLFQNIPPWVSDPLTQLPFGNRMTIQIKEAGLQSYSDINGNRHHFEYKLKYPVVFDGTTPNMLEVEASYPGSDKYIFTEPLIDLQTLTLIYRNPDLPVIFDPDFFNCTASIDFIITPSNPFPTLTFTFPGHGLLTGDALNITGFNSGSSILDGYINRTNVSTGILNIGPQLIVGAAPSLSGMSQNISNGSPITQTIGGINFPMPNFYIDPFVQYAASGPITVYNVTSYTPLPLPPSGTFTATISVPLNGLIYTNTITLIYTYPGFDTASSFQGNTILTSGVNTLYCAYTIIVSILTASIIVANGTYTVPVVPRGTIGNYKVSSYSPSIGPTLNAVVNTTIAYEFGSTQIIINWVNTIPNYSGNFSFGAFSGSYTITGLTVNGSLATATSATCIITTMSTQCGVYVAKRRMRIPVKIRCVVNKVTNYINLN